MGKHNLNLTDISVLVEAFWEERKLVLEKHPELKTAITNNPRSNVETVEKITFLAIERIVDSGNHPNMLTEAERKQLFLDFYLKLRNEKVFKAVHYDSFKNKELTFYCAITNTEKLSYVTINNKAIPITSFLEQATDDQINLLKNSKTYQHQKTLFDLSDAQLASLFCKNWRIINLMLKHLPTYQLERILKLMPDDFKKTLASDVNTFASYLSPKRSQWLLKNYGSVTSSLQPSSIKHDRTDHIYESENYSLIVARDRKTHDWSVSWQSCFGRIKSQGDQLIRLKDFWDQLSNDQIQQVLKGKTFQRQHSVFVLKPKTLITITTDNPRVFMQMLKLCPVTLIEQLFTHASPELIHQTMNLVLSVAASHKAFFTGLSSKRSLAILKGVSGKLPEFDTEPFVRALKKDDMKIFSNGFNSDFNLFNLNRFPPPFVRLENENVRLYISQSDKPSHAVFNNAFNESVPLKDYWEKLSDESIARVFSLKNVIKNNYYHNDILTHSVRELESKSSLYDLDDHILSPIINESMRVVLYFLRSAPYSQQTRILKLADHATHQLIIDYILHNGPLLHGLPSNRCLRIFKQLNCQALKTSVTNNDQLSCFLRLLNADDKLSFLDYFSGLLLLPSELQQFAGHPQYPYLSASRLKKYQPDIAPMVSAANNPHYTKLGVFKVATCKVENAYEILKPYGFSKNKPNDSTQSMLVLSKNLSINDLKLLIYLVTGLPPQHFSTCKALLPSQCLSPDEALCELNKAQNESDLLLRLYSYGVRGEHFVPLRDPQKKGYIHPAYREKLIRLITKEDKSPEEAVKMIVGDIEDAKKMELDMVDTFFKKKVNAPVNQPSPYSDILHPSRHW